MFPAAAPAAEAARLIRAVLCSGSSFISLDAGRFNSTQSRTVIQCLGTKTLLAIPQDGEIEIQ